MSNQLKLTYYAGAQPSLAKKRKVTDDERKDQKKKYEKDGKRARNFKEWWKDDRPWLQYDEGAEATNNLMFCTVCIEIHGKEKNKKNNSKMSKFIHGSSNIQLSTIKDHEAGKDHKDVGDNFFLVKLYS